VAPGSVMTISVAVVMVVRPETVRYPLRVRSVLGVIPDVPLVPDVPDVPELPLVPDVPSVPEVPLVPLVPEVPSVPLVPEVPEDPFCPDVPLVPDSPDVPLVPDVPDVPDVPLSAGYPVRFTVCVPFIIPPPISLTESNCKSPSNILYEVTFDII